MSCRTLRTLNRFKGDFTRIVIAGRDAGKGKSSQLQKLNGPYNTLIGIKHWFPKLRVKVLQEQNAMRKTWKNDLKRNCI
jgi:hypothetical protein